MKRLTTDAELVKEAIRNSDLVQLDETSSKVRANSKRLMLLVRGIPEGTSHEVRLTDLCLHYHLTHCFSDSVAL